MQRTATEGAGSAADAVDVAPTGSGLVVHDRNARERCRIGARGVADLRSVDATVVADPFPFTVDAAVEFRAGGLTLPDAPATIRDQSGDHVGRLADVAFRNFSPGRYLLELHGAVPCVLAFESGFTLAPDGRGIEFDGSRTAVRLGARSATPEPSTTVTTTEDPADVMAAISTFGSAVPTRGPERSLPAFRRHPPALERGEDLRIPDGVEPPASGPTIELPPRRAYAYAAAPLSAYLGATVEPAERAHLVADDVSYALSGRGGVEAALARVLKQVFTLDSICRTAGRYPGESHEGRAIEPLGLDWERLYDADPAERLDAYLSVPYGEVEPAIPQWHTCAHVEPTAENLAALPSLAADLATVRSPPVVSSRRPGPTPWTDEDGGEPVRPERSGAVEDAWFGAGTPLNATKGLPESARNRFEGTGAGRGDRTEIAVLAPDPDDTDAARAVAGGYDDPTIAVGLSRRELRRRLRANAALLHLVGDVGTDGVACADGWLDLCGIEGVGADLFVMDSCSAHRQATALAEAGARGGVAAFHESPGERPDVGVTLARLLGDGFPPAGAVDLATTAGFEQEAFLVVGDGATTLANTGSRPPVALVAESLSSGYAVRTRGYATDTAGVGSRIRSPLDGRWALTTARRRPETLDADAFEALCEATDRPVVLDGAFR